MGDNMERLESMVATLQERGEEELVAAVEELTAKAKAVSQQRKHCPFGNQPVNRDLASRYKAQAAKRTEIRRSKRLPLKVANALVNKIQSRKLTVDEHRKALNALRSHLRAHAETIARKHIPLQFGPASTDMVPYYVKDMGERDLLETAHRLHKHLS